MDRKTCLVCAVPIPESSSRLGIEACRACSSFFKRTKESGRTFVCRQGNSNCAIVHGERFTCRHCRYAKCVQFGMELQHRHRKQKQKQIVEKSAMEPECPSPSAIKKDADWIVNRVEIPHESSIVMEFERECVIRPNVQTFIHSKKEEPGSATPLPDPLLNVDGDHEPSCSNVRAQPILEMLRSSYRSMCETRLIAELLARPHPPHPMLMNEEDCSFVQATLETMITANRILLTTIVSFAKAAFPEFRRLSRQHQWALAVNFSYRFRLFESAYRADKHFPADQERLFGGYTSWYTHNYDANFFKDCRNSIDVEQAKSSMHNFCKGRHLRMRALMRRLRLEEAEFMYAISLMFWTTEGSDLPEDVASIAETKRIAIMQEIHVYYTAERRLDVYAARLGEVLTAVQMFDNKDLMRENYEFLRLINVFSDDTFLYRVHREDGAKLLHEILK